jgi:hypothetical protein
MPAEEIVVPEEISRLWAGTVEQVVDKEAISAKAPARGINWRIDLLQTAKALFKTSLWVVESSASLAVAPDPTQIAKVCAGGWEAIQSILAAVREQMQPVPYCAYVVLSNAPQGLTPAELAKQTQDYVTKLVKSRYPLYWIGLSRATLQAASDELAYDGVIDDVVKKLKELGYVKVDGGRVHYVSRNWTTGFSASSS